MADDAPTLAPVLCSPGPRDAVSRVQFLNLSGVSQDSQDVGNLLVASWDDSVTLYNATTGREVAKRANISGKPLLGAASCSGSPGECAADAVDDFFCGGLTGGVYLGHFSRSTETLSPIGTHDAAVACIQYAGVLSVLSVSGDAVLLPRKKILRGSKVSHCGLKPCYGLYIHMSGLAYSGGWDAKVKVWDRRLQSEAQTISARGKVFALAVTKSGGKLAICDSQKTVLVYDTRNLSTPEVVRDQANYPVLKHQLRAIEFFPDETGFIVSSIEGRVAWEYLDPQLGPAGAKNNYSFKCHREKSEDNSEIIYAVNTLAFHSKFHSFATGGRDCAVGIWDGYNRKRLWKSSVLNDTGGVTSLAFHSEQPLLAIGISDGRRNPPRPHIPGQVIIQTLKPEAVTPKSQKSA